MSFRERDNERMGDIVLLSPSKRKRRLYATFGVLSALVILGMVFIPEWLGWLGHLLLRGELSPELVFVFGILLAPFAGYLLIRGLRQLFSPPTLIMNREGIVDNASAIGVGLIRWEEIERMYEQSSKALTWLCIVPRNVETFISRQSPFKGLLLRLSEVLFGAPIRIPDRSLPTILVAKTLERISEYLEASSSEFPPHTSKGGVRGTEELIFSERRIGAEEDAREVSGLRKYSARIGAYGATWGICFYGLLFIVAWVFFLSGGGRASTWFIYPGMFVAFSILGLAGAGLAGSGSRRIRAGAWLMLGGAAGAVASVVANDIFGFWPLLELETLLEDPTNLFGPYAVALLGAAAFAPVPMLLIAAVLAFVTHGRAKG